MFIVHRQTAVGLVSLFNISRSSDAIFFLQSFFRCIQCTMYTCTVCKASTRACVRACVCVCVCVCEFNNCIGGYRRIQLSSRIWLAYITSSKLPLLHSIICKINLQYSRMLNSPIHTHTHCRLSWHYVPYNIGLSVCVLYAFLQKLSQINFILTLE